MSFLHAVEMRRKRLEEAGDAEAVRALPLVTCFERADAPGGVWRANRAQNQQGTSSDVGDVGDGIVDEDAATGGECAEEDDDYVVDLTHSCPDMYESLWTNGPVHPAEYFDYSFDEHFGHPVPVYMPRQPLLEYMLARVTRRCPTFFDRVEFGTSVAGVKFNERTKKFEVETEDSCTRAKAATRYFDVCIWAGGGNGLPKIPRGIRDLLREGGFVGATMHSSDASSSHERFREHVEGKRILIIGDGESGEDMLLQAIKVGVEQIFAYSRSGDGDVNYTSAWPSNRKGVPCVKVIRDYMPTSVLRDGRGLRFTEARFDPVEWRHVQVEGGKVFDICDIDTIIYCTGYDANMSMLDRSLCAPYVDSEDWKHDGMPPDWTMAQNPLSDDLGDVQPAPFLESNVCDIWPGIFRGLLMSNPSMMFIYSYDFETQLLDTDVKAWLCLAHLSGDLELPDKNEMQRWNASCVRDAMQITALRRLMDSTYCQAWKNLEERHDGEHWSEDATDLRNRKFQGDHFEYQLRCIARDMQDSKYPFDVGTFSCLNEKGRLLLQAVTTDSNVRLELSKDGEGSTWRTFRDCDHREFVSIHTGTRAVALKKAWLHLCDSDPGPLVPSPVASLP
jgi:hypothetical protein